MTALHLGLDFGGSRSKWHLLRGEQTVASGFTPPLTAALLDTPQGATHLQALAQALPALPGRVHAGLPGFSPARPDAGQLRAQLCAALGVQDAQLTLESDLDLAYRAHLHAGRGVLLYAGTGSVAYHVTADGRVCRAGGHGYLIDDDGAGYALGRGALRWLTREQDHGRMPQGPLADALGARMGGVDWDTVRAFAYEEPGAARVASLAPALGEAADAGDEAARAVVEQVAGSLCDLALAVQAQVGAPLPVTATGGALRVTPLFMAAVRRRLPGVTLQFRDHAQAAAREASRSLG